MAFFAGEDRETLRQTWREAWRKQQAGLPLGPLEMQIAAVALQHPEYHSVLAGEGLTTEARGMTEAVQANPYLHMSLHLAVRDGIGTDRPAGIRAVFEQLLAARPSAHSAEHVLLDCLGEVLWQARRGGLPPDERAYLDCARQRLRPR
jgi:hypothetical protein